MRDNQGRESKGSDDHLNREVFLILWLKNTLKCFSGEENLFPRIVSSIIFLVNISFSFPQTSSFNMSDRYEMDLSTHSHHYTLHWVLGTQLFELLEEEFSGLPVFYQLKGKLK